MERIIVGSSNTARKWSSVRTSRIFTPVPQLVTTERSATPAMGTKMLKKSQAPITARATHFQPPRASGRWRDDLPFIDT